jgi:hypothetical protein
MINRYDQCSISSRSVTLRLVFNHFPYFNFTTVLSVEVVCALKIPKAPLLKLEIGFEGATGGPPSPDIWAMAK